MQAHQIKSSPGKKKKRVGRGGKKGTYSGKGMKGQKSRAGRKLEPPIRGIIKRYHKLRGYNFNTIKEKAVVVGLKTLNSKFSPDETVSPQTLVGKKIIGKISGKIPKVKILKNGSIEKPLVIINCLVSASAGKEIEKAGGKIKN